MSRRTSALGSAALLALMSDRAWAQAASPFLTGATALQTNILQWLSSTTRSEHSSIEPAVLDSEIEQLPDLSGYLKCASVPEWYRVRLTPEMAAAHSHAYPAQPRDLSVSRYSAERRERPADAHTSRERSVRD